MTEQTTLYFKDGSSDKVYQAAIEPQDDGFIVTFAYGRKGATLTTGTKTKSPVSLAEAKAIYDKLIVEKTGKGYTPEEHGTPSKPKRVKWQHEVSSVSNGQFSIEPKKRLETIHEDFTEQEWAQGFMSYPQHATIFCDDVWTVTLDAEMADTVSSLDDAVQAACLPIELSNDHGLYIRTVDDDGNQYKIGVPRGKYDMLVRIFATEQNDTESDDDFEPRCNVSLTFLQRGTVGPKCFKRDGYELPSSMVIHTSDEETQEFPI
jgi:predicted DNA-binding WGR domain protein